MRVLGRTLLGVIAAGLALTVAGCNGGSGGASGGGVSLKQLQIEPVNPAIAKDTSIGLTVTGIYSDQTKADLTSRAKWSSSDPSKATIGSAGGAEVTAVSKAKGTTTISATVSGMTASTTLTVTDPDLIAVDISPAALSIAAGTKRQVSATGRYSDGTHQDLTSWVTWQSSDTGIVQVSGGLLTGMSPGSATVTATMLVPSPQDPSKTIKVQGSATVTVSNAALTGLRVEPASPSIAAGTTTRLSAVGVFSDGSTQDLTGVVTWRSSATGVATVTTGGSAAGLVVSQSPGSATITADFSNKTGSTTVTVTPAVLTAIGITPATPVLPKGAQRQLSAVGTFSDGSTRDITDQVTWTSSNDSVAGVGNASGFYGLVSAFTTGDTVIGAAWNGVVSPALSLHVSSAALVSINVTPASAKLAAGTSAALTATGNYSDGSTLDITDRVTWGSTDGTVAGVSNTAGTAGHVQAQGPGSVVISAILGQQTGAARIDVTQATLSSIDVTPANPSVAAGLPVTLQATGHYSDGSTQDLTDQVSWQSSDETVVAVSNASGSRGQAATLAPGSATVTALYGGTGGTSGATTVTVTNAQLTGIQVTPSSPNLVKGATVQLSATGTYTDSSQQDVTSQVTWSSSDSAVATVGNGTGSAGTVSGTGTGQATVTAALGSVQGTTTVSVTADPNAPVSLTAVAQPDVIVADNTDKSAITVTVRPADPAGTVPDGTLVDFAIDPGSTGNGQLSANSAVTAGGTATVHLTAASAGTIKVVATVNGTQVSNAVSVYATTDLSSAIGTATFAVAPVTGGIVPQGSVFSLYIYNLSGRSFDLTQYQMTDGQTVLNTVTNPQVLNNGGKLLPGQGTGILFTLSQDEPDSGFTATYTLKDQTTGTTFTVGKTYVLN